MIDIDATETESELRKVLPPPLDAHAGGLARLLVDAASGALTAERARARVSAEPAFAAAFEALAGRQVGPLLTFGQDNQLGDVTVGDVAGGHVLKFHVLNVGG